MQHEHRQQRTAQGLRRAPAHPGVSESPFVAAIEQKCEHCGGSGYDWGSLRPMEPDVCEACHGRGTQIVRRDYLAEALRIVGGKSAMPPQREHLEAVVRHCRALVEAVMVMPVVR